MLKEFQKVFRKHIFPITGGLVDCYNQFPKKDANYLYTKTLWKYFMKMELMIPWNIIIQDTNQEADSENYTCGTQHIEMIFMFKIDATNVVQVSLDAGTLDTLIETKVLQDGEWNTVADVCMSGSIVKLSKDTINKRLKLQPYQINMLEAIQNRDVPKLEWQSYNQLPE